MAGVLALSLALPASAQVHDSKSLINLTPTPYTNMSVLTISTNEVSTNGASLFNAAIAPYPAAGTFFARYRCVGGSGTNPLTFYIRKSYGTTNWLAATNITLGLPASGVWTNATATLGTVAMDNAKALATAFGSAELSGTNKIEIQFVTVNWLH